MKIGIFDSGLGGLTVLNEVLKRDSQLEFCYIGDNEYCPYGEKNELQIKERIEKILEYLKRKNCKKILIACNTASIIAEKYKLLDDNIIGISNIIKKELKKIDNFIVYGTKITVTSKFYQLSDKNMEQIYSEKLAALIETVDKIDNNQKIKNCIKADLISLDTKIEKIILCCTHYSIVKSEIMEISAKKIVDFSSYIGEYLFEKNQEKKKSRKKNQEIIFTKCDKGYKKIFFKKYRVPSKILEI